MRTYLFIVLIPWSLFASNGKELLIGHDKSIYNPAKYSTKEVSFTIEIDGLAKEITALKSYGVIKEIKYLVTVKRSNQYDIKIKGVSEKFNDLNKNLKMKVVPYIEILFPKSLSNFYRSYSLKLKGRKVTAIDKSYLKPIRESFMLFSKNGVLKENKIKTAQGTQIISFEYGNGPAGFKRLLTERINRKVIYGPTHLLSNTSIIYEKKKGNPYPQSIVTEFIFENKENNLNGERVKKLREKFVFSNFKFN